MKDGHHRVSMAKWLGMRHIDAEVVEYDVCSRGVTSCTGAKGSDSQLAALIEGLRMLLGGIGQRCKPV